MLIYYQLINLIFIPALSISSELTIRINDGG